MASDPREWRRRRAGVNGRATAVGRTPPARIALRWLAWFLALALLTVALRLVHERLDKAHVALAYLLVVLGASAAGGRALGLTLAGAAFLAFNLLFVPPYHTFVVANPVDWIVLVAFLATSAVAAELLSRATATAAAALARAEELDRLATLGAETLSAPGAEEALHAVAEVVRQTVGADRCEVYRRGTGGALVRATVAPRAPASARLHGGDASPGGAERRALATPVVGHDGGAGPSIVDADSLLRWLADRGRSAVELFDGTIRLAPEEADDAEPDPSPITRAVAVSGLASLRYVIRPAVDGAPRVRALLLPLVVRGQTVGVVRIASEGGVALTAEQARVLVALAYFAALGVERVRLEESAERAEAERRVESLRSALLTAVSHDLRTPLTTIKGIAHEVAHGADRSRAAVIEAEADRLNDLVSDLLDLSRIQSGALHPDVALNTVEDLVGAALQRAGGALPDHAVHVELPPDGVLVGRFDFTQSLRALVNLLENAAKYAPAGTPIELRAARVGDRIALHVLDRGPGVPPQERVRIFEPFYRPPGVPADVRGTGLGLSIARGLAEAQGGTVRYAPRDGGGSTFALELPAADAMPLEEEPADADPTAR